MKHVLSSTLLLLSSFILIKLFGQGFPLPSTNVALYPSNVSINNPNMLAFGNFETTNQLQQWGCYNAFRPSFPWEGVTQAECTQTCIVSPDTWETANTIGTFVANVANPSFNETRFMGGNARRNATNRGEPFFQRLHTSIEMRPECSYRLHGFVAVSDGSSLNSTKVQLALYDNTSEPVCNVPDENNIRTTNVTGTGWRYFMIEFTPNFNTSILELVGFNAIHKYLVFDNLYLEPVGEATNFTSTQIECSLTTQFRSDRTGSTYIWNFGDGNIITTTNRTINHNYTSPGNYQVILTVIDQNACLSGSVRRVDIIDPSSLEAIVIGDTEICNNHPINLCGVVEGSIGTRFQWFNGRESLNEGAFSLECINISQAGTYTLVVTTIEGCRLQTTHTVIENCPPLQGSIEKEFENIRLIEVQADPNNGGYIASGYRPGTTNTSILMKLDDCLNQEWSREVSVSEVSVSGEVIPTSTTFHAVTTLSGGGYAATGFDLSGILGSTKGDFNIFRFDNNGILQWNRATDISAANFYASSIIENSEGNIVALGQSQKSNLLEVFVICRDSSEGNFMWLSGIGNAANGGYGYEIREVTDGYIIVGFSGREAIVSDNLRIIKIDRGGNFLWADTYELGFSAGFDLVEVNNLGGESNVIIVGGAFRESITSSDGVALSINPNNGNINWIRSYDAIEGGLVLSSVVINEEGNVLVSGNLITDDTDGVVVFSINPFNGSINTNTPIRSYGQFRNLRRTFLDVEGPLKMASRTNDIVIMGHPSGTNNTYIAKTNDFMQSCDWPDIEIREAPLATELNDTFFETEVYTIDWPVIMNISHGDIVVAEDEYCGSEDCCVVNTGAIEGPVDVCINRTYTYCVRGGIGSTFSWTITGGNEIILGNGGCVDVRFRLPLGARTITVVETTLDGCVGDPITFNVNVTNGRNCREQIGLVPNPANNQVTIDVQDENENEMSHIRIIDMYGVERKVMKTLSNQPTFDVSDLPNGLYNVVVTKGGNSYTTRLQVNH